MRYEIELNEDEIKTIKRVRNYFRDHDATQLEYSAYSLLDKLVRQLEQKDVDGIKPNMVCNSCYYNFSGHYACIDCDGTFSNWTKKV